MKHLLAICTALFALAVIPTIAQADESIIDLVERTNTFKHPELDKKQIREILLQASETATTAPGKGWCLYLLASSYDGIDEHFEEDRAMVVSLYEQADKLLSTDSDELKALMTYRHPGSPSFDTPNGYAKHARYLVKSGRDQLGPRRVQRILLNSAQAVEEGKYELAAQLYRSAIAMAQNTYRDFATILGGWQVDGELVRIPVSLQKKRRFSEAEALLQDLLARDNRLNKLGVLKDKDYVRAMAADNFQLGECFYHLKKYDLAEQHFKKALAFRQQLYGQSHACPARVMGYLAQVYQVRNRKSDADRLQKQVDKLLPRCPTCASNLNVLPYCYGDPIGVNLTHFRQEFAIGGCISNSESPNWACTHCHQGFRNPTIETRDKAQRTRRR